MDEGEATPLQRVIRDAVRRSGKTRDFFDKLIQQRTGTTGKPIWDIDRGKSRRPSAQTLQHIADAFDLPMSYFTNPRPAALEPSHLASYRDGPQPENLVSMRQIEHNAITLRQIDLGFSMGDGANIDDYVDEGTIEFDANLLRAITHSPPERLLVARGSGDSMMPTLLDGDMTIIDTLQHNLTMQDRIWAVSIYGAGALKRLRTIGQGRVLVISDNAAVDNQEVDAVDLRILGRLIWSARRY